MSTSDVLPPMLRSDAPADPSAWTACVHAAFVRNAMSSPDALALHCDGRDLSYGELWELARGWAHVLAADLPATGGRVGIFASRSVEAYAGVLAALEAGAAFVPFLHTHPPSRLAVMASLAEVDAVVVDAASLPAVREALPLMANTPSVFLPFVQTDGPGGYGGRWVDANATPTTSLHAPARPSERIVERDTAAYLLFTSGTTGTPKAVQVSHGNVRAFVANAVSRFPFASSDRFSQTYDLTFDPAIFDLFVAWEVGASVHVLKAVELMSPGRFIERRALTVWSSVPSIIALMRRLKTLGDGRFPALRYSMFCGEGLSLDNARAWQSAAPNAVVENLYGPTEATVVCTGYRVPPAGERAEVEDGKVPIGIPFPGHEAVIVDDQLRPVDDGALGELCIAGPQVALGYWGAAEQTARAFVHITTADGRQQRFYRTGDLARRLPSLNIACLGRVDHQVKILGRRVELGEIETRVAALPGVDEVCALGWPLDVEARPTAVAIAVTGEAPELEVIRAALLAELPEYMVPTRMLRVPALPLNVNGKVDRRAIAALLSDSDAVAGS